MNTFFTIKTCGKLQKAGCVSQSGFFSIRQVSLHETCYMPKIKWPDSPKFYNDECQVFTPWDFLAKTEQGYKNQFIAWGSKVAGSLNPDAYEAYINERRFGMMLSKNPEQYLLDTWVLGREHEQKRK